MSDIVPTFKDLSFYSNALGAQARYDELLRKFEQTYGCQPEFVTRAPGRVNLIGDHIDYNNFAVLPMAIEPDVIAAVKTVGGHKITLANVDTNFKLETIDLDEHGKTVEIDQQNHSWGNYFKCALIVAHKYILEKFPHYVHHGQAPLKGMNVVFDGIVPTGGGLSSSAAFCVSSTLAVLRANGVTIITKSELTRITVVCEHYVGLNNGGMDQCASIYGEKGKALLIQFKPQLLGIPFELPVTQPHEMVFLISNSLLQANKYETAPTDYNLRVVEMAVASELLAKKIELKLDQDSNLGTGTMRDLVDKYFEVHLGQPAWDGNDIDVGIDRLSQILEFTELAFANQKEGFTTAEAAAQLNMSVATFTQVFLTKYPVRYEKLMLYQRSKHVFSEALRVLQVLKLVESFDPNQSNSDQFLTEFGRLFNESHQSCHLFNESSKPALNRIWAIATANGAYGARVTGAGFGGSMVHLTTIDKLPRVMKALTEQYYKKEMPDITEAELKQALVVSRPSAGTCVVDLIR